MSVSSVSNAAPILPPAHVASNKPAPPPVKTDGSTGDDSTAKPTPPPLPPGQGTRVDQLV